MERFAGEARTGFFSRRTYKIRNNEAEIEIFSHFHSKIVGKYEPFLEDLNDVKLVNGILIL